MKYEHYDCGWCAHPTVYEVDGSASFACSGTDKCPFIKVEKEGEGEG